MRNEEIEIRCSNVDGGGDVNPQSFFVGIEIESIRPN